MLVHKYWPGLYPTKAKLSGKFPIHLHNNNNVVLIRPQPLVNWLTECRSQTFWVLLYALGTCSPKGLNKSARHSKNVHYTCTKKKVNLSFCTICLKSLAFVSCHGRVLLFNLFKMTDRLGKCFFYWGGWRGWGGGSDCFMNLHVLIQFRAENCSL